jgi:chromosome segregation ATPase
MTANESAKRLREAIERFRVDSDAVALVKDLECVAYWDEVRGVERDELAARLDASRKSQRESLRFIKALRSGREKERKGLTDALQLLRSLRDSIATLTAARDAYRRGFDSADRARKEAEVTVARLKAERDRLGLEANRLAAELLHAAAHGTNLNGLVNALVNHEVSLQITPRQGP